MNPNSTIRAVLPEKPIIASNYLKSSRLVVTMMTNNPFFPAPVPPLAQVSAKLDALEASEDLAHKGGKGGAVQQRDVDLRKAHRGMTLLKVFVQNTANEDPEQAEVIIKSAGMDVAKPRSRNKQPVEAKYGDSPGCVVLVAKALPKPVQYRWQLSTDQKTWTDLPETFKARTTVEGLTPATIYSFRLRTLTNDGPSEWSPTVTIIAH